MHFGLFREHLRFSLESFRKYLKESFRNRHRLPLNSIICDSRFSISPRSNPPAICCMVFIPSSRAQGIQRPSLMLFPFSSRVTNITATFLLHLEHNIKSILSTELLLYHIRFVKANKKERKVHATLLYMQLC